jgi:hypothetical protein
VSDLFDEAALARIERQIDEWLGRAKTNHANILAVDRSEEDEFRWYVRMAGEEKDFTTIWFTLGQSARAKRRVALRDCVASK